MIEIVIGVLGTTGLLASWRGYCAYRVRVRPILESREGSPKRIEAEVRDELEQNPAWWDRLYQRALEEITPGKAVELYIQVDNQHRRG